MYIGSPPLTSSEILLYISGDLRGHMMDCHHKSCGNKQMMLTDANIAFLCKTVDTLVETVDTLSETTFPGKFFRSPARAVGD